MSTSVPIGPSAGVGPPPCRLLKLPGELRNRIYRYALVTSEDKITISSTGYARSNILLTCKDIHKEAIRIFFTENVFESRILNFDASIAMRFYNSISTARAKGTLKPTDKVFYRSVLTFNFNGDAPTGMWSNLMTWLRKVHGGNRMMCRVPTTATPLPPPDALRDMAMEIVENMFEIALELKDQPWSRVEKILGGMRASLVKTNARFED